MIDDGRKRIDWRLGKVEEIFRGRDGEYRVAKVKVDNGELVRPVQRLYKLECDV